MPEQQTEKNLQLFLNDSEESEEIRELAHELHELRKVGYKIRYSPAHCLITLGVNGTEIRGYINVRRFLGDEVKQATQKLNTEFPHQYTRQYLITNVLFFDSLLDKDSLDTLVRRSKRATYHFREKSKEWTAYDSEEGVFNGFLMDNGVIKTGIYIVLPLMGQGLGSYGLGFSVDSIISCDEKFDMKFELLKHGGFDETKINESGRPQRLFCKSPIDFDNIFPNIDAVWKSVDKTLEVYA